MYNRVDGYLVKISGEGSFLGVFQGSLYLSYLLPTFSKSSIKKLLLKIVEDKNATLDTDSIVIVREALMVRFDYIVAGARFQRFSALIELTPVTTFKTIKNEKH